LPTNFNLRTALFCVVTQLVVVILTDVSGEPIGTIFRSQESKSFKNL